ncbi:hypothetical protein DFH06DRAFT_1140958 [Mycena polygramma]|nr:hypothetical protein DFH06DRAFT_1140958 [Mycena polygramma]
MPHAQFESLTAHSTVPLFAPHSTSTTWQSGVNESGDGMENESGTAWATADSGTELHVTATTVCNGIDWPIWDAETQAFFATHIGPYSADGSLNASLDPLERANSDLLLALLLAAPPCTDYDNFMASLGIPPLEPPSAHDFATDTIIGQETTYELENHDEGMDDNVATSPSASAVPPTEDNVGLTWLPVSTPQQVASAAPAERAPHNMVMTSVLPHVSTPYDRHPALSTSYFASQPAPAALNYWRGAQYPAGPSHMQNANFIPPGYPMSATTTPSAYHLSLPPTPATAGPSVAPSSGPVRTTRTRSHVTTRRRPAAPAVPVRKRRGHCSAVATLSDEDVEQTIADAKATQYAQIPTVRCDWAGCTAPVDLKGIFEHLKTVHGVKGGEVPTLCRWGNGKCRKQLRGDGFRKHVLSESSHLNLKLTCPSCNKGFQSDVTLRKHLKGAPLVG